MIHAILFVAVIILGAVLPHLPGRYDVSAATLSVLAQVASFASLPLVPIGLAWVVDRTRERLWRGLALAIAGIVVLMIAVTAAAMNQSALGVTLGIGGILALRRTQRRGRVDTEHPSKGRNPIAFRLAIVPLLLVAFVVTLLPKISQWSRDRAIQNSAMLIREIEKFRERRGHYPVSLQSLNHDVPTGVIGIQRFQYEPNGEAYNVFFVRPAIEFGGQEVVMFNPRDEHRFASHDLDILQYDGELLDLRRGDRWRTGLPQQHWISILFD